VFLEYLGFVKFVKFIKFIGFLKFVAFFGVIVFDYLIPGLSFFLRKSKKTEISEQALSTVPRRFATRTAVFLESRPALERKLRKSRA